MLSIGVGPELAAWRKHLPGWGSGAESAPPLYGCGIAGRGGSYLAKAIQGFGPRVPVVMHAQGCGGKRVLPLQQQPQVAPGQSWGQRRGGARKGDREREGGSGIQRSAPGLPRCWASADLSTWRSRARVRLKVGSRLCSPRPSSRKRPSSLQKGEH